MSYLEMILLKSIIGLKSSMTENCFPPKISVDILYGQKKGKNKIS